jgi:hypothetical protein
MSFARIRLIAAILLFLAWIAYLGYTAATNYWNKPDLVSRAQLTEATALVVADLTTDEEGKPKVLTKITHRLSVSGPVAGTEIVVENLPSAQPPGKPFPGPGEYLLPLIATGDRVYRIAGLPRSPGYPPMQFVRPVIYPWTEAVKAQIQKLGYGL